MSSMKYIDTSFVPAEFAFDDWSVIEKMFRDLLDREVKSVSDLEQWWRDRSELESAISEEGATRYIAMTCRTDDEEIKKAYLNFVENVEPRVKPLVFALNQKHASLPVRTELDPGRYRVLNRHIDNAVRLFRKENVPIETELDKLAQQYNEVCGAMTVEFDGKEQTLPQMARYLEETDRDVREKAWRGVAERRLQDRDRINEIFDGMRPKRHQLALNAGFDNYRDFMFRKMERFDYTPEDCERFHNAVERIVVPLQRKINRERAEALGLERLRPWDLQVDVQGRPPLRPFQTADQLVERTQQVFSRMDPSLGALFNQLREPDVLDLESRKGKAPGGYQYQRDRSRRPFIFMNSAGLARDAEVLLHEAGHAFHSLLCADEPLLQYRHSPIEFAEVASMSMELLAMPFIDAFYPERDIADRARRQHLEGIAQSLPWIATIDAFQHWIYTNPGHNDADRRRFWRSLLDRFGPEVDWTDLENFRDSSWQRQLHLFDVPFYYIEYGIAQLGALQMWVNYQKDASKAISDYKKALSLGGSQPLPKLFEAANIRFDFGVDMMREVMNAVEAELDSLPI
ncbi:MAG: M3 family oligoendopeptidase [Planctomycetota bacterium]